MPATAADVFGLYQHKAHAPDWLDELYPRPWRVHREGSRAAVLAKNGARFMRGINNEKAVLIVLAINALAN